MITIRTIRPDEIPAAKHLILEVAYAIFGWDGTLQDSIRHFESSGEFEDMDHVQSHYFDKGGLFLAVLDADQLIGCGAVRLLDKATAELKRIWLREAYHGRGLGYQVTTRLLKHARARGCGRVRLQTNTLQTRAIAFYRKLGFYDIPCYNDKLGEISMELLLDA